MMKNKITVISVLCVSLFLFLMLFGRAVPSFAKVRPLENEACALKFDKELFYRQTVNNCGPYSVMAVANILSEESLNPEVLSKEMRWRIYKNLTFPQGVVDLLHKYNISTKEKVIKNKTDEEKIVWVKNNIENGNPVILLIKVHHVLHYVTVLGYNRDGFMLYDSMQEKQNENPRKTVADIQCVSGNRFYSNKELIDLWNDGGYKIFFKNWAIVCSKSTKPAAGK